MISIGCSWQSPNFNYTFSHSPMTDGLLLMFPLSNIMCILFDLYKFTGSTKLTHWLLNTSFTFNTCTAIVFAIPELSCLLCLCMKVDFYESITLYLYHYFNINPTQTIIIPRTPFDQIYIKNI